MTDAVVTVGLEKRYPSWLGARRERAAISGLDVQVPAGGITGVLGPNGAGKTTLARLILGLARPTAGITTVLGRDVARESLAVRREVAFVTEERDVFGWMRTGDLIAGVGALSPRWDAACAARLVAQWSLDLRARLRELSHGTRSRLLLLIALSRRASLLVLDEPTTGLDPAAVEEALSEMTLAAADGATILLVTHRLEEVERICDRVIVMNDGQAIIQDDLDDLRAGWRLIDVAGRPDAAQLRGWPEVVAVTPIGDHHRLLVRNSADAVIARVRDTGGEVTSTGSLSLREIYLGAIQLDRPDAPRRDLA